jgi:hypothetical protein
VYLVIRRGQGDFDDKNIIRRTIDAAVAWIGLVPTWRVRRGSSLIHAGIAWAFMFYLLVNLLDIIEGYFPIKFGNLGVIGGLYSLIADVLSVAALAGVVYFLLRRFVFNAKVLRFRDNVKLMETVKPGLRRDSAIVGFFILFHIGFRFLGQSFAIAREGANRWQPFANLVSMPPGGSRWA